MYTKSSAKISFVCSFTRILIENWKLLQSQIESSFETFTDLVHDGYRNSLDTTSCLLGWNTVFFCYSDDPTKKWLGLPPLFYLRRVN